MRRLANVAAALAALAIATPAAAQQPAAAKVDPGAMKALSDMGAYLRTLKAFQVRAVTTDEDVLDDGQKVQYEGTADILARMPNGVRAEVVNDRHERLWLYDGKRFTLYGKRLDFYATIPAPPTIGELAAKLDAEYGLGIPLADLFRWGQPGWSTDAITSATDLGPSVVGGTTCQQYAFRQAGIDWQVWIQKGDYPLPRRLVITTTSDDARPQHTATFTWNLAPSYNDAAFTFDPPAGAGQVVLAKAADAAAGQ